MSLEETYVTTFNELLEGKFTITIFNSEEFPTESLIKDKEKNTVVETRNTLLYEWYKDNNELELVKDLFDYIFVPETDPDLKGCDFKEISFIVSPETRRALGIEAPKRNKSRVKKKSSLNKNKPNKKKDTSLKEPKIQTLEEELSNLSKDFEDFI